MLEHVEATESQQQREATVIRWIMRRRPEVFQGPRSDLILTVPDEQIALRVANGTTDRGAG